METSGNVERPRSAKEIQRNFWWFAICFALNHGTVTTPLVVASSLLDEESAYAGNGILYVGTCVSSLLLGAPMTAYIGAKNSLLFGMTFYCVYVVGFTLSAFFSSTWQALSVACWLIGSTCGGIAAGVLWTAQGSYFAASATLLAEAMGETREAMTAALAGKFAMVYLVLEVASKLMFSLLQTWLQVGYIGVIFSAVALVSTYAMMTANDIGRSSAAVGPTVDPLAKVFAAASLWSDPIIWLLSPTNFAFGFCAAFMNGYVNANFTKVELGADKVATLAAMTALVAAILSRVFGAMGKSVGKGVVLFIGHACFFCIPLSLFIFVPCLGEPGCKSGWGYGLVVLYLLQGAGRAVYESTNRAAFSDFFTGSQTEGAFANCMLQSSLAFSASFFMQAVLKQGVVLEVIVMVLAGAIVVAFPLAKVIQEGRRKNEAALLSSAVSAATSG